jgi:hypothetical protein
VVRPSDAAAAAFQSISSLAAGSSFMADNRSIKLNTRQKQIYHEKTLWPDTQAHSIHAGYG